MVSRLTVNQVFLVRVEMEEPKFISECRIGLHLSC